MHSNALVRLEREFSGVEFNAGGWLRMRRLAFFAHYDRDGIVDAYVVHYLSVLLESGIDHVYFASDCNLEGSELEKLPARTRVVHTSPHGEYDFGSWKRCFADCESEFGPDCLSQFEELVLCNDSCYGPLSSLNDMFDAMAQRSCDYWGVTHVEYSEGYYPTFFLVLRKHVLADSGFSAFMKTVGTFDNKQDYCDRYEVGLNRLLETKGFIGTCYLEKYPHLCHSSVKSMDDNVFDAGMPFVRVLTARSNPGGIAYFGKRIVEVCERYGYPVELIEHHLHRIAPEFRKYWCYKYGDVDRRVLSIIRIRRKPKPETDKLRWKVWIFGIPVFYGAFPMKYDFDVRATNKPEVGSGV